MTRPDPGDSLKQLAAHARKLLARAQGTVTDLVEGRLPAEGATPLRLTLSKVDALLEESSRLVSADRPGESVEPPVRVATLLEITRALSHVLEEGPLFELIMDLVIEHTRAERGFLVLRGADGGTIVRTARNVEHENIQRAEREISNSIIEEVFETGEPLLKRNALDDVALRDKASIVALRILSVLAAPLRLDDEVYGVVYLESRSVQGLFDERDLDFIRAFSEQAGLALSTARTVETARRAEVALTEENVRLRAEVARRHSYQGIIGRSRGMQEMFALIERVGPKPVTVLIRGENGTGKELIARVMHYNSPRAKGPFVAVNCAALPETLIESELFGIEKGTATSVEGRSGKFEVANGGTLFLDEVGDMSLVTQAKLLRVIQEREIERVGGRRSIPVDVRIVAATNVDLEAAIEARRFRQDLYYRLNVVPIVLPPLREREGDVPLLAVHFLERLGREFDMPGRRLTPEALECLSAHDWPGNVRELENVMSRAIVLSQSEPIGVELLPAAVRDAGARGGRSLSIDGATLEDLEQMALVKALDNHDWIQTRAAEQLGITERNLRYKMKKFGLKRPAPKDVRVDDQPLA